MKKHLASLLLLGMTLLPAAAGAAEAETDKELLNPVTMITGKVWQESSQDARVGFIYGIRTAVTVEHFVNGRIAEDAARAGRKPASTLSPFARAWASAFRGVSVDSIVAATDAWYAAHPDRLDRPVMEVLWYEQVEPRNAAAKAKGGR